MFTSNFKVSFYRNWKNVFIYFICSDVTNPLIIFWPYQVTWCFLSSVAHLYLLARTVFFFVCLFCFFVQLNFLTSVAEKYRIFVDVTVCLTVQCPKIDN